MPDTQRYKNHQISGIKLQKYKPAVSDAADYKDILPAENPDNFPLQYVLPYSKADRNLPSATAASEIPVQTAKRPKSPTDGSTSGAFVFWDAEKFLICRLQPKPEYVKKSYPSDKK